MIKLIVNMDSSENEIMIDKDCTFAEGIKKAGFIVTTKNYVFYVNGDTTNKDTILDTKIGDYAKNGEDSVEITGIQKSISNR